MGSTVHTWDTKVPRKETPTTRARGPGRPKSGQLPTGARSPEEQTWRRLEEQINTRLLMFALARKRWDRLNHICLRLAGHCFFFFSVSEWVVGFLSSSDSSLHKSVSGRMLKFYLWLNDQVKFWWWKNFAPLFAWGFKHVFWTIYVLWEALKYLTQLSFES